MTEPKFKIGDVLRVVRHCQAGDPCWNGHDRGSEPRGNFVVANIDGGEPTYRHLYWPKDGEQGAYESQLEYQTPKTWKERFGGK